MDSEGQTSSATITINVAPPAPVARPRAVRLPGGGSTAKAAPSRPVLQVRGTRQFRQPRGRFPRLWHDLAVSGGSIGNLNGGSNRYGGTRTISASALAGNGLLDDGATLWFSVVMGYGTNYAATSPANMTRLLAIALANQRTSAPATIQYYILNEGSQLGSGLGVTLGSFDSTNGKVVATQFRDSSRGTSGTAGNVFGNVPVHHRRGQHRLVVGKITWGAQATPSNSTNPMPIMTSIAHLHPHRECRPVEIRHHHLGARRCGDHG
jgi:hypothetical protein